MKAVLRLTGMRFLARHGVMEQERRVGNTFTVSIVAEYDATGAATSDDIADAVSYADIHAIVRREMEIPSQLLEHVAARIIAALRRELPALTAGSVTVAKPHPPIAGLDADDVSVTLAWE